MTFDEQLKFIMKEHGLSNYALAKRIGTHPTTVANWLDGKSKPQKGKMYAIAEEFGYLPEVFADGAELVPVPKEEPPKEKEKTSEFGSLGDEIQILIDRPETRELIKATRGISPTIIKNITSLLESVKAEKRR